MAGLAPGGATHDVLLPVGVPLSRDIGRLYTTGLRLTRLENQSV